MEYSKVLVEVYEVLQYLSEDELAKIPEDIMTEIRKNKDRHYKWEYDKTKPLKHQKLSRDAIILLSYLNMEYLLNKEQKELMQQIHEFNDRKRQTLG